MSNAKGREDKKKKLKGLLKRLQEGEEVGELKEEFKDLLKTVAPQEIPLIEQELIEEGVSTYEISKMCDIHVELFRESVQEKFDLEGIPSGHPLHTLYQENERITKDAELLVLRSSNLRRAGSEGERKKLLEELKDLASGLMGIDRKHYGRQEMIVFPHIERRGIQAVPRVLWRKHGENMGKVKQLLDLLSKEPANWGDFAQSVEEKAQDVSSSLVDMVFRENNILYPTLKELLSRDEWVAVSEQEKQIGYYKVQPGEEWNAEGEAKYPYEVEEGLSDQELGELPEQLKSMLRDQELKPDRYQLVKEEDKKLDTGFLNMDEINAVLNSLPVDITFIDSDNRVRFFSGGHRIFPRTRSVLGRPVKFCHPPGSVDKVKEILKEFKAGRREEAEFWIQAGGKFIHIRFFPVRGKDGKYLGTLEVTQDVTGIRELEGEKRILN